MTEILAGAVGGLIALLGAFGVQVLVTRERRAAHARALAASFLSELQLYYLAYVRYDIESRTNEAMARAIEAKTRADQSGTELALLVSPSLSAKVRAVLDACPDLLWAKAGTEHDSANERFRDRRKLVEQAIHAELGRGEDVRS